MSPMSDEEWRAENAKDIPDWWKRMHPVPKTLLKILFWIAIVAFCGKAILDNLGGGG
jgi:hypothetical protein